MAARRRAVGRDAPSRVPETAIVAFITLFAAWTLRETHAPEALALVGLGAGALAADALSAWSPAPDARPGVDASATLGLLSLPWTFAARAPDGMTPRDAFALWTCVTAGALTLARDVAPRRVVPGVSRASTAVLAALVCAAAASTRLMETGGASLTAHAALGACVLAHALPAVALASRLPPMFPGVMSRAEAALVAQSAALAATAAAAAAAAVALERGTIPRRLEWLPGHVYERRDDTSLLVLFGALAACGLFAAAPAPPLAARAGGGRGGPRAPRPARASRAARSGSTRASASVPFWCARSSSGSSTSRGTRAATTRRRVWPGGFSPRSARRRSEPRGCGSARFSEPLSRWRASRTTRTSVFQQSCFARYTTFWLRRCSRRRCAERPTRRAGSSRAKPSPPRTPPRSRRSPRWRWRGRAAPRCVCRWRSEVPSGSARRSTGCSRGSSITGTRGGGGVGGREPRLLARRRRRASVAFARVARAARDDAVALFGPFAGIVAVGIGDTCASVAGVRLGKTPAFRGSRKTVEGAAAGAAANAAASWAFWRLSAGDAVSWRAILTPSLGAAWLETATEQSDNAFVPLAYLALLGCASRGSSY